MLKNPCKSTRFYSDTRDRRFHFCVFLKRLADYMEGLQGVDGMAFSSHLPSQAKKFMQLVG